MKDSKIEWTDHTFNPWSGCAKVSPGCAHCYAESLSKRVGSLGKWGKGAERKRTGVANWLGPVLWNKKAEGAERRPRVFCASLADWLDDEVPAEWLADLLHLIFATPNLDWLLLTKRPQRFRHRLSGAMDWIDGNGLMGLGGVLDVYSGPMAQTSFRIEKWMCDDIAPPNVWIGTTVEDQQRADERIPQLLQIPAAVRFLSCEPLLGPVDLGMTAGLVHGEDIGDYRVDWVIAGGESGPGARPMHPAWARSLRNQCAKAGVPFLFKQWGEWVSVSEVAGPGAHHHFSDGATVRRAGKKLAGRTLDGTEHNGFPATEGRAA